VLSQILNQTLIKDKMKKLQLVFWILLFGGANVLAQQDSSVAIIDMHEVSNTKTELSTADETGRINELTHKNAIFFKLSRSVLGFGLIVIVLETILILRKKIEEENAVRFIVVTLIITAALFLITAGYSNDQIAPVMGLLGAIAGYLLGKTENRDN
jgi:hypothetical protein